MVRLEKMNVSDREKLFVISLYPKGRYETSALTQLKQVYPITDEELLKTRMGQWMKKIRDCGIVKRIQTPKGNVLLLTPEGMKQSREWISKLFKTDIETFIKIMNRLVETKDAWAIKLFEDIARTAVYQNMPLHITTFTPQPMDIIVKSLKEPFRIDVTEPSHQDSFRDTLRRMDALGLIEIKNNIVSSTELSRRMLADIIKAKREKSIGALKSGLARNVHDDTLLCASLVSTFFSFFVLVASGSFDYIGTCLFPLLVIIFYRILSFMKRRNLA